MGFAEFLTLIFVILKVSHVIAWSWWAVFAPMWICYGFIALIFLFCFIGAILK